ncbi:uncharacterized protein HGUI_02453 [Hanseniaspora guilliermondii]|uniref:C2H2-type domain-containing protein n=1 Tax=Hanseniaspora guilliermondii TaxID=56406 RepID=A0A1L0CN14_9ASCO|nr:uncharacterized protein HGUI_02453 [Hanseniaspora guilliermondii]
MSESKKLTFGRRTWNRDEYKSTENSSEKANEKNFISTRITLPMGLEKRIQRQYNLTSGGNRDKKLIAKQRNIEDEEKGDKDDKLNSKKFKCYICGYQFNNDLKLIEHWNTDKHIERLTQSYDKTLPSDEEKVYFPHDYEKNYSKDKSIIQQHLQYLQETIYKPS